MVLADSKVYNTLVKNSNIQDTKKIILKEIIITEKTKSTKPNQKFEEYGNFDKIS